jgi:Fe-S cluster assembly protein SufD
MNDLSAILEGQLNSGAPAGFPEWVGSLRNRGATEFRAHGFPNARLENWKYTSLRGLERDITGLGRVAEFRGLPASSLEVDADCRVVMGDGAMVGLEGRPRPGLEIQPLAEALDTQARPLSSLLDSLDSHSPDQAFSALNNATLEHGLVIRVLRGVDAGRLHLQWSSGGVVDNGLFNARVCLLLGEGARLELVEHFDRASDAPMALNLVTQVQLEAGAGLIHSRLQRDGREAMLVTRTVVDQAADSHYTYTGLDLGGGLVRHDLHSRLQGEHADCVMNGAYLPRGRSHIDNHLEIEHQAKNCGSSQFFRGVLDDRGRAVFNGRVHVHPGADGSEARQSNANLLLSANAEVNTKPELEIEADEVVASHGATVGQLDEDAVFYMRSRGLDRKTAQQMLTTAFCQAAVDRMPEGPVRAEFTKQLGQALAEIQ